jgi:APA family basic amino acid/polyamine antiporter
LLILTNASKATASLFAFMILLSTAAVLFVYAAGALAAWKETRSVPTRTIIVVALLFILFAFYGAGLEADLWSIVLLAIGLAVRTLVRLSSPVIDSSPAQAAASTALRE